MTSPTDLDQDHALRALLGDRHVEEGGFTDGVMAKLPAARPRRRASPRNIAIVGGAFAAGIAGFLVTHAHPGALEVGPSLPYFGHVGLAAPAVVVVVAVLWGLIESATTDGSPDPGSGRP